MDFNELEFVEWLSGRATRTSPVRVGDDMAMVDVGGRELLVSSDMLLDGVHFDTGSHPLDLIGRKAVCCALSDCAAMAVAPRAITVSIAFPRAFSMADARRLFEGILSAAGEYGVDIAGGDTTRWLGGLAIDVAIVAVRWDGVAPVLRGGARVGDRVYVTGALGGSRLGKHLRFVPRIEEAKALAQTLGARLHAMIDVTDGLSLDLWRICRASGVGAVLEEDKLTAVIGEEARRCAAEDGRTPLDHALADGEDFELLAVIEGEVKGCSVSLLEIGVIAASGLGLRRLDGRVEELEPRGYVH